MFYLESLDTLLLGLVSLCQIQTKSPKMFSEKKMSINVLQKLSAFNLKRNVNVKKNVN